MHEMLQPPPGARPRPRRRRRPRLRLADRRPGRRHRQDRGDQGRAARHRRRRPAQPLLRLRARGGQRRRTEGRVGLGGPRAGRRRRVDVTRADRLGRRRLGDGPRDQLRHVIRSAGRQRRPDRDVEGFSREDVDAYAARSQERAAAARAEGRFDGSVVPVLDINEPGRARPRRVHPPRDHRRDARRLKPSFARSASGRLRRRRAAEVPLGRADRPCPHPGNSSGIVDGASLLAIGNERIGAELGLTPARAILATAVSGADPTIMLTGPAPASRKALEKAGTDRSTTSTWSRSTRRSPRSCSASSRTWASIWRRSTSTAARSRWAIRSARPAAMILGTLRRRAASAPAAATGWRRFASAAAWASRP